MSEVEQDLSGFGEGFGEDGAPPPDGALPPANKRPKKEFKAKRSTFQLPKPTADARVTQANAAVRDTLEKIRPKLEHLLTCDAGYLTSKRCEMPPGAVHCAACVEQVRDLQRGFYNAGWTNGSGNYVDISEYPSPITKIIAAMRTQPGIAKYCWAS